MNAETLGAMALVITALGGSIITPIVIAYFGRKQIHATTIVAEKADEATAVNRAVLTEVKTANAKASGDVVDAIWNEQIRQKGEAGTHLSADEQEHAASMAQHKIEEGKEP